MTTTKPTRLLLYIAAACTLLIPAELSSASASRSWSDRAALEAFVDGLMAASLSGSHIAGATVAIVKDGEAVFTKGYGYADVERRVPVNAGRTLFRVGSVSKLFVWTAVMQLVERGRLNLDAAVDGYVDFEIPATYQPAITLRHILTHTPGFEEDYRGMVSDDPTAAVSLREWLPAHMPARVRPPGTLAAYSNYATTLAAYIVERASGLAWDDYLEQRILSPLRMDGTSGRQPLPDVLRQNMSQGYRYTDGRFQPQAWEVLTGTAPAGALSTTAVDMAAFMLAHLQNGVVGDGRILGESTAAAMRARTFGHDPRFPGTALGFIERDGHGPKIIGHGGNLQWFHTDLALVPSEQLGIFVSFNTDTGKALSRGRFIDELLAHYYFHQADRPKRYEGALRAATNAAGWYAPTRSSYTTFQKAALLTNAVRITAEADGSLLMSGPVGLTHLVPAGPLLYSEAIGDERLAFRTDGEGNVTHAFIASLPVAALERLAWYQSPPLHWGIIALALIVFVGTLWASTARWIRYALGHLRPEDKLPGRLFLAGAALFNLLFMGLTILIVFDDALATRAETGLWLVFALPVIAAVLAGLGAIASVGQWRAKAGTPAARFRYSATIGVVALFTWSLSVWNLLGWRF